MKSSEEKYKMELSDIKQLYQHTLEDKAAEYNSQIEKIRTEITEKMQLELQKKDFEIEKLKLSTKKTTKTK